jgi:hypothetical protein
MLNIDDRVGGSSAKTGQKTGQENAMRADVSLSRMQTSASSVAVPVVQGVERRRTVVALLSASIISLVVWGLVVALNVH